VVKCEGDGLELDEVEMECIRSDHSIDWCNAIVDTMVNLTVTKECECNSLSCSIPSDKVTNLDGKISFNAAFVQQKSGQDQGFKGYEIFDDRIVMLDGGKTVTVSESVPITYPFSCIVKSFMLDVLGSLWRMLCSLIKVLSKLVLEGVIAYPMESAGLAVVLFVAYKISSMKKYARERDALFDKVKDLVLDRLQKHAGTEHGLPVDGLLSDINDELGLNTTKARDNMKKDIWPKVVKYIKGDKRIMIQEKNFRGVGPTVVWKWAYAINPNMKPEGERRSFFGATLG
jgi:hypothetical protein